MGGDRDLRWWDIPVWMAGSTKALRRMERVSFIPLLEAAAGRQVLRQAGAVYQFRHAELQDLLVKQVAD